MKNKEQKHCPYVRLRSDKTTFCSLFAKRYRVDCETPETYRTNCDPFEVLTEPSELTRDERLGIVDDDLKYRGGR